ncbi:hypothetical protein QBC38DRAFT_461908 [Podospora fimiseda]|uniref:NACHT domain-containing protein n=1 Tax=Podospora fimiseda TaxID=252190 RepID=A0AAN6YQN8_9PEZI|nr:hypothetical protein QBC38DRAFT_461908 [Podospora fimiseda]
MDPLSISMGVLASLQVANSILSFCRDIRSGVRQAPWTLLHILQEVRDLRNLIEAIESISGEEISSNNTSHILSDGVKSALSGCLAELQLLEHRLKPGQAEALLHSSSPRRQAFVQSVVWRLKDKDAHESISGLQRCKATLNLAISSSNLAAVQNIEKLTISLDLKVDESHRHINALADDINKVRLDERYKAIVNWLSPLNSKQAHVAALTTHQTGTSEWLIQQQCFLDWKDGRDRLLWLSGSPGSGKTVLMSHIIEYLSANEDSESTKELEDPVCAYVYCDFRNPDAQSLPNILGSVLSQLCSQLQHYPEALLSAYTSSTEHHNHWQPPSINMMLDIFQILGTKRQIYLLVDAVDEAADCKALAEQLLHLSSLDSNIRVFAASRNEPVIQSVFEDARRISLENHVAEVDNDIREYAVEYLSTDRELRWLSPELQNLILDSLLSNSKGAFRWATCQIDSLRFCRTIRDVKKSLKTLPKGLNGTYERILSNISGVDVPILHKALTWLSFSASTLTLQQLWEALAIELETDCIDDDCRLTSPQDILTISNGLLTVSPDGSVSLAHLSVRDYLLSPDIASNFETAKFALNPGTGHLQIVQDCLTYLNFNHLSSGPCHTQQDYLTRLEKFPLLRYATRYWFYHARNSDYSEELQHQTLEFFSPLNHQNFMSWVQVFNADMPFKWHVYPKHATALYYAASLGLDTVVESLLQPETSSGIQDLNNPGSRFGGTPLHAAVIREHLTIVKRLLAAAANPAKADFDGVTPLHSAASQGSLDVIRVLLDHGAPIGAKDGMAGKTPAEWARLSGRFETAELIEQGQPSGAVSPITVELMTYSSSSNSAMCRRTTSISSSVATETVTSVAKIRLWQPKPGYFPDKYEKRSGVDASLVVGMEKDGGTAEFEGDFTLDLARLSHCAEDSPMW